MQSTFWNLQVHPLSLLESQWHKHSADWCVHFNVYTSHWTLEGHLNFETWTCFYLHFYTAYDTRHNLVFFAHRVFKGVIIFKTGCCLKWHNTKLTNVSNFNLHFVWSINLTLSYKIFYFPGPPATIFPNMGTLKFRNSLLGVPTEVFLAGLFYDGKGLLSSFKTLLSALACVAKCSELT